MDSLKKSADPDDQSQILFSEFTQIALKHGAKLKASELKLLLEVYPGQQADSN